jgi:hypothetical protein
MLSLSLSNNLSFSFSLSLPFYLVLASPGLFNSYKKGSCHLKGAEASDYEVDFSALALSKGRE